MTVWFPRARYLAGSIFVAGLLSCAGVLTSARSVLDRVLSQVQADEATLTAVCSVAVDEAWDNDSLEEVLARCDAAYDLYDRMEKDIEALKKELDKSDPDESKIANLVFNIESNARKFAEAVAALAQGDE